jgi:hypothetical protein
MERFVYFIRPVGERGPVKIGCSFDPEQRLASMTRKARPLEIVAVIKGDFFVERQFHTRFRSDHIGKEWFFWSPELGATIDLIAAGTFDVSLLPQKPVRLPRKRIEYTPERRAQMSEAARRHAVWLRAYRAAEKQAISEGRKVWHSDVNLHLALATGARP